MSLCGITFAILKCSLGIVFYSRLPGHFIWFNLTPFFPKRPEHAMNAPSNPNLMHVATQAQQMARNTGQEKMAIAFQSVAMVSMAVMSVSAGAHLIRALLRSEKTKSRGRE